MLSAQVRLENEVTRSFPHNLALERVWIGLRKFPPAGVLLTHVLTTPVPCYE